MMTMRTNPPVVPVMDNVMNNVMDNEDAVMPEAKKPTLPLRKPKPRRKFESMTQTEPDRITPTHFKLASFVCIMDSGNLSTQVSHDLRVSVGTSTESVDLKGKAKPQVKVLRFSGPHGIQSDKESLKRLAGVSPPLFNTLSNFLPHLGKPNFLTKQDCLLLCLVRLKLGLTCVGLEALFGIHPSTVQRIFLRTLPILTTQTKSWIPWPPRATVTATMDASFQEFYPSCRVILDIIEIKTQKPSVLAKVRLLYSKEKKCCMVKFLIGMSPGGLITFVSRAYGGKNTDDFITMDSGLVDLLEPGDMVLVEKGFTTLEKSLEAKGVGRLIRLSEQTDGLTPVGGIRDNIQGMLGKVKTLTILNNLLPVELFQEANNIVHLCSVITNLEENKVRVEYTPKK